MFGVVVPGRPVITEFTPINESKAVTMLQHPTLITEITFFLLSATAIPPGYGAILYYSIHPFEHWQILGSISPHIPSGTFRTGWSTKEEFQGVTSIQLGVALEP